MARQRLGLRPPAAAVASQVSRLKSGSGLPQSKTSRNLPTDFPSRLPLLLNRVNQTVGAARNAIAARRAGTAGWFWELKTGVNPVLRHRFG
jgi:hypothetical protein